MELPVGTVTFLLTDVEGSTRLWEQHGAMMGGALARHDQLISAAVTAHGGLVIKSRGEGDALFAVFARASDGVAAALAAQLALHAEPWPAPITLRVRMALHTGEAELRGGDYFGPVVNRAARLRAVGHGGQVLLSEATAVLARPDLPAGAGLRPLGSHRLKDLAASEAVSQLLHPALPDAFQPLRSLDTLPNNLPVQVTQFIGREQELADVQRLLGATRLLTLTGAGGTGKTRLALQVAADALDSFPDGVWLVDLASLSDPAAVPQVAAQVLGVREEPGRTVLASLTEHLRDRQALLLLDNCEHLIGAVATLASTLLRACPKVRLLATSREALAIAGETTWQVPPLGLPDRRHLPGLEALSQYAAVRLFIDRAAAAVPGFAVTNETAPVVAEICYRLDGIPLAIELAAARVKVLSPDEIRRRLDDRFRLLTSGDRTALPRQQTLRALVDWSYDLLSESERTLWRRLAAFAGPFSLAAAEAVAAGDGIESYEVLDLLAVLVEKSLVVADRQGAETRYRLLETIRRYGEERLRQAGEEEAVRNRHQEWYLALAEEKYRTRDGAKTSELVARIEAEYDNMRAALAWAQVGPPDSAQRGLRLAAHLISYWQHKGIFQEAREQLTVALGLPGAQERTADRALALNGLGITASALGDRTTVQAAYREALGIARELNLPERVATYLSNLAFESLDAGELAEAEQWIEELERVEPGSFFSLRDRAVIAAFRGENAKAVALFESARELARTTRQPIREAMIVAELAGLALDRRDLLVTRRYLDEARELFRDRFAPGVWLMEARLARYSGEFGAAVRTMLACVHQVRESGIYAAGPVAIWAVELAWLLVELGRLAEAVRFIALATALRESKAVALVPATVAELEAARERLRQVLDEADFNREWAAGEQLSIRESYALALGALAGVAP